MALRRAFVVLLVHTIATAAQSAGCTHTMCGCAEGSAAAVQRAGSCDPLGECEEYRLDDARSIASRSTAPAVWQTRCRCFTGYSGAHCGECDVGHAMWPRCYEAATRSNSAAEKGGKQPKDLAKVLLVTPSQFEATTAAILCILCVGVCLAAAVRWRLCCVGRCVSDTWRYTVWYFEGPDEETESLLKDPACNEEDCSMRHPHKHHRDGSISVRRSRAERRRGAARRELAREYGETATV